MIYILATLTERSNPFLLMRGIVLQGIDCVVGVQRSGLGHMSRCIGSGVRALMVSTIYILFQVLFQSDYKPIRFQSDLLTSQVHRSTGRPIDLFSDRSTHRPGLPRVTLGSLSPSSETPCRPARYFFVHLV